MNERFKQGFGRHYHLPDMLVHSILVYKSGNCPVSSQTLGLLGQHLVNPRMLEAALQTAWKVGLALVLVLLLGLILGLLLGLSETFYDMFRPIVMFIQAVPVVSWLSLVIFAWGVGWRGPIFITFVSLLPTAVLTVSSIRNLDKDLLEMAGLQVPFKGVPLHLPRLSVALYRGYNRCYLGQAWKVVLVSEPGRGSGLGVEYSMPAWWLTQPVPGR